MTTPKKTLQIFSPDRIENDRQLTPAQILDFLHDYQLLHQGDEGPRKLISIRVPGRLLELFRAKAERQGKRYQTEILRLMRESLEKH
jgi:uncharacterized protein (DUF4415 family)